METPFVNDPFALVYQAFRNLYPEKECEVFWETRIRDSESGEKTYGLTDFGDDGSAAVFVDSDLKVTDAVEILAHELAHVGVGIEHDHDEVWEAAFNAIFQECNRIGDELFGQGEKNVNG